MDRVGEGAAGWRRRGNLRANSLPRAGFQLSRRAGKMGVPGANHADLSWLCYLLPQPVQRGTLVSALATSERGFQNDCYRPRYKPLGFCLKPYSTHPSCPCYWGSSQRCCWGPRVRQEPGRHGHCPEAYEAAAHVRATVHQAGSALWEMLRGGGEFGTDVPSGKAPCYLRQLALDEAAMQRCPDMGSLPHSYS